MYIKLYHETVYSTCLASEMQFGGKPKKRGPEQQVGQYFKESMDCFIEGQTFSWSYVLSPPHPPPPSPVSGKLDRRHTGRQRKRDNLLTEEKGKGGRGAESYDRKKARYSVNHSIPFGTSLVSFVDCRTIMPPE